MTDVDSLLSEPIEKIKADEFFADITVGKSYGAAVKPTCPERATVICGFVGGSVQNTALEQDIKAGSIILFADIYVPWSMHGFDIAQAVSRICAAAYSDNVSAVKLNEAHSHTKAQCFVRRTEITYSDIFKFAGGD